jgi:hypothetical protein
MPPAAVQPVGNVVVGNPDDVGKLVCAMLNIAKQTLPIAVSNRFFIFIYFKLIVVLNFKILRVMKR